MRFEFGSGFLASTALLAAFWVAVWYVGAWLSSSRMNTWPPSTVKHENSVYWGACIFMSSVNAMISTIIGLPCGIYLFVMMPESMWFFGHLGVDVEFDFCTTLLGSVGRVIAFAGQSFTIRIVVDWVLQLTHRLLTVEESIHHAIFFIAGVLLRSNCMLPLNTCILMSMEASTPALNYYLFFRKRYPFSSDVNNAKIIFSILFCIFRLGFGTYGAYLFLRGYCSSSFAMPVDLPAWEQYAMCIIFLAGTMLQWFWGFKILQGILQHFGFSTVRVLKEREE